MKTLCKKKKKTFQVLWNFAATELDHMDQADYEDQSCFSDRNTERMKHRLLFSVSSHRSESKTMI